MKKKICLEKLSTFHYKWLVDVPGFCECYQYVYENSSKPYLKSPKKKKKNLTLY